MIKQKILACMFGILFYGCVISEENSEISVSHSALRLETRPYSQSDPAWRGNRLGRSGCPDTIASHGCVVTSLAMMYNYYQPGYTNPGTLNSVSNFTGGNPCFIDWNNAATPAGISTMRRLDYWSSSIAVDYLDRGYPVIAKTSRFGGHFFLIIGYNDRGDFILNDPVTGAERLMSGSYAGTLIGMRLFTGPTPSSSATYTTEYNRQSPDGVREVFPGDTVDLIVSYRNTGSRAWSNDIGSSDYIEPRSVDQHGNPTRSWLCHSHWLDGGPGRLHTRH